MKVSLFPFLPVLLCMMGAMIMLLVLVAWDIQESATTPSEAAEIETLTVKEAEELRYKIETSIQDADWYAEHFTLAQKQAEEELAENQARLAHAEQQTQKLREELVRLEQLAKQIDSQTEAAPEEVEHLKRLLAQQQQRLADAELELAELRKEAAQREKSYAIVPSRTANGTFRRPIYIECREDKIIIQPEGIELFPGDFQALDEPANPFDTVLRVIRQYYMETEQTARGSEPYPLLIVRPSGVEMYENARMATKNWVKDFGYEIVNEDWNIQYPQPDAELRNRINQQLEIARNRLSAYMVARRLAEPMPGYGGSAPQQTQQFRMDHRGNVVPVGGSQVSPFALQEERAAQERGGVGLPTGERRQNESHLVPHVVALQEEMAAASGQEWNGASSPLDVQEQGVMNSPSGMQHMQRRPQDWALKGATQFTSGISRGVVVRCESDRFVLSAQSGLRREQSIPILGSVSAAADQLVRAIWEFQESWGSAGANMHWRPILQVRVVPGGEQRLQELKVYLRNSGLHIEEVR